MRGKKPRPFVKSADTDVPVDKTIEDMKALVRRYGAAGFGVRENYETRISSVDLVLPNLPGERATVPVQIPVRVDRVYKALYESPRAKGGLPYKDDPEHVTRRREQAERVAWRHAFYTIEVALMTAELGGRPISDSLMADVMVVSDGGRTERMGDYMERTQGALAPGVRALLGAPKVSD